MKEEKETMANITRWDPFGEVMTLREAMNSLFEDSFVSPTTARGGTLGMALDVAETSTSFIVEASLPGVRAEDLDITLQNNVLTISGETRQQQTSGEKANYHRVERRYGRFSRSVSLPMQVQSDKVDAQLSNGILRLEIPKAEAARPRKITVNGNGASSSETIDVEQTANATNN
jgi:HSP20 family protein